MTEMLKCAADAVNKATDEFVRGLAPAGMPDGEYIARAVIQAIKESGVVLVPATATPGQKPKLTWGELKPGMVVCMRRSGVRRIVEIEPNRHGADQQWARVKWVRVDEGRYRGKIGWQSAAYFAREVVGVIDAALGNTKTET